MIYFVVGFAAGAGLALYWVYYELYELGGK